MSVYVLDKQKKPLMPCSEKRARKLLSTGRAVVHKRFPFTIRLKDRRQAESTFQRAEIKLDPGSKTTGLAVVIQGENQKVVKNLVHIVHRGHQISEALAQRAAFRCRRRNQLWHRPARFYNRTKPKGWLAPSLRHRVDTTLAWVNKLNRLLPDVEVYVERVKFDTQLINNPDISGVEYQQGTLWQLDVKEYLLYTHQHTCQYCHGESKDPILEVEHVHPRSKGGGNRIGNLTLACRRCNTDKDALTLEQWSATLGRSALDKARAKGIERVKQGRVKTQRDIAAVNATRNSLFYGLLNRGYVVSTGTGGMTKFNRQLHSIPKDHALDAVCVGAPIEQPIVNYAIPVLEVKCMGRGSYQRTRLNKYGFPRGYLMRNKSVHGFQTGDMVVAQVTTGSKIGTYKGRVAVRASGSFNIQSKEGLVQGISYRYCRLLERSSGYGFNQLDSILKQEERDQEVA